MKLFWLVLFLFVYAAPAWSRTGKVDTSTHTTKSVKEDANEALNNVDKGVHKGLHAAKEGAEQALDAIDTGVHKVVGKEKK